MPPWKSNPISQRDWDDAHVTNAAIDIHHDDPAFGYRFIVDELSARGIAAGQNRVARALLPAADLVGVRQATRTLAQGRPPGARRPHRPPFNAAAPNLLWLTDVTEHPTYEGKLYLCAIKDVDSNRIVGYSIDSRMKASLAVVALRNAIGLRNPAGTIVHSDRGSQGGFNWWSQHLDEEVWCGRTQTGACGSSGAAADAVARSTGAEPAGDQAGVLAGDRRRSLERGGRGGLWRVAAGGDSLVS